MKSNHAINVRPGLSGFIDAYRARATVALMAIVLAACGGGSGDGSNDPQVLQPPPASDDSGPIDILMQVQVPADIAALSGVDLQYTIELKGAGIVSRVNPDPLFEVPFAAAGSARYYYRIEIHTADSGLLIAIREGSRWIDRDQTLVVDSSHFRSTGTDFDSDGDGISNLQELQDELNPSLPESTRIDFSFQVADWVKSLHDVGFIRFETLVDSLANDDGKFAIAFNPTTNRYEAIGFGLEAGGQPRSVGIGIRVNELPYHFSPTGLSLGIASRLMTLQSGVNEAHFEWSDFGTDWDLDRDGVTNLEELRRGTDPVTTGPEYTVQVVAGGVAPIIDGDLAEASWYSTQPIDEGGNAELINAMLLGEASSSDDLSRFLFTAVHDFVNLYIGVRILDYTIVVDSAERRWHDDSIEIYIDGNNSRLNSYDGIDDLALNFRFADASAQAVNVVAGTGSIGLPANLDYAMVHDFSQGVTVLELKVPLAELNIDTRAGIGLDIQYNDDDNSGDRDRKYGWRGPDGEDNAWMNPTWFGEVGFSN